MLYMRCTLINATNYAYKYIPVVLSIWDARRMSPIYVCTYWLPIPNYLDILIKHENEKKSYLVGSCFTSDIVGSTKPSKHPRRNVQDK